MKMSHIAAAVGLVVAAMGVSSSANAQPYSDRGNHGYNHGYRGDHRWDNRRHGWRDHRRCWTEWRHHRRVRVCR